MSEYGLRTVNFCYHSKCFSSMKLFYNFPYNLNTTTTYILKPINIFYNGKFRILIPFSVFESLFIFPSSNPPSLTNNLLLCYSLILVSLPNKMFDLGKNKVFIIFIFKQVPTIIVT